MKHHIPHYSQCFCSTNAFRLFYFPYLCKLFLNHKMYLYKTFFIILCNSLTNKKKKYIEN